MPVSETKLLQCLFGVCACIIASVCASIRICPDHNLYNNAWISKQCGTVVTLEEEKCYLKFFLGRLKVKVMGQIKVKRVNKACPGHNLYIYAWILN